uniref:signal peptidase I n=1 Tax=Acetatifactor sp. TaxID=1872090 RepID=UPI004055AE1F
MARRQKGLSFYRRRKKISSAIVKEIFSWVFGIVVAVFLASVANYFFGMTTSVVGVSMESTLFNGQKIYINRFLYTLSTPKEGDVVVFLPNGNENAHYYVKRVVGVPGDKIQIISGVLYVNGSESEWITEKILESGIAANEFTLQSGEYFCIGDNPNNSEDSRSANVGPVKEENIIGKAWLHLSGGGEGIGLIK